MRFRGNLPPRFRARRLQDRPPRVRSALPCRRRATSTPTAPIIRQSATDFAEILGCRRVLLVLVDGGARVVRMPAEGRQV